MSADNLSGSFESLDTDATGLWMRRVLKVAALFWTLVIVVLGLVDSRQTTQSTLENARASARQSFNKDLVVRHWASEHGGVYAPVDDWTRPSPYLAHLPERDLVTPSGRRLTLLNPSYITRQLHEIAGQLDLGSRGHVTSLQPIRPENAPDAWERRALHALAQGAPEVSSLEWIGEHSFLRLMRPLPVEKPCLACHSGPSDTLGAIRGGISEAIPWKPYQAQLDAAKPRHFLGYGGIWLLGMIGLVLTGLGLNRHLDRLRQVESKLRRNEEKYRLLAEGTAAIPWEFNLLDDRWDYVAPQVTRVLGYPPEEWTNLQFWADHIHEEDRKQAVATCSLATGCGEDHEFEYRFLKKDGGVVWLRDVVVVEMADGRPVRLRGVMIDLTERKALEERLRHSAKMEAVGTLAAGVAHDFNNILTAQVSFATLLKRRHAGDAISLDYIGELLQGSARATELVRSLLSFSRKQKSQIRPEDLNDIVAVNQKMLRRMIREDIEITSETANIPLPVMADWVQIEQVIMNLAVNAQDAMPHGGGLRVATAFWETEEAGLVGRWAELSVTDTGTGVGKEEQARIFDPFFTTKEVGRGTGLGLAIVHGIVEQHGGRILVESEEGRGTSFRVLLPLLAETSVEKARKAEVPALKPDGGGHTILLAEDNAQVRHALKAVLVRHGYWVVEAEDGEEALRTFEGCGHKIDLLLSDVVMPGKSGFEAYEAMRKLKPGLPAIFVSGYTGEAEIGCPPDGENWRFITKPMNFDLLLATMKELLEKEE